MKCYIVTPTYNSLHWLPRCVRSVASQVGGEVQIHHHVQDGGSSDGTVEWLRNWCNSHSGQEGYTITFASGKDAGMYDAINKAWDCMPDDAILTAHLNSDEQYLPGALAEVLRYMNAKPEVDVLLGTYIIVDAENEYICHRRPVIPRAWSSWLNCACITNSSFYRADAFRRLAQRFDTKWRCVGDLVFFRDLIRRRVRFDTIPVITSLFVCTGDNLAWTETAHREWLALHDGVPWLLLKCNGFIYRWVNFKRRVVNIFSKQPKQFVAYNGDCETPIKYPIVKPTVIWKRR